MSASIAFLKKVDKSMVAELNNRGDNGKGSARTFYQQHQTRKIKLQDRKDGKESRLVVHLFHPRREKPALKAGHSTLSKFGGAFLYLHSRHDMRDNSIQ